jgi:hypothetical protein
MTYTGTYTAHRDGATYTPAALPPRPKSQGTYTRAYTSYMQIGPTREGGLYIDPRVSGNCVRGPIRACRQVNRPADSPVLAVRPCHIVNHIVNHIIG